MAKDYRERLFSAIQSLPNRTQTDRIKSVRLATAAVDHCNTLIKQIQIMENVWLTPAPFMEHDSWFEHNANQPDFEEFDVGKLMKQYPLAQGNQESPNWSFDNSSIIRRNISTWSRHAVLAIGACYIRLLGGACVTSYHMTSLTQRHKNITLLQRQREWQKGNRLLNKAVRHLQKS